MNRHRPGRSPLPRSRLGNQPLAATELLLVDGNNLLHRLAGGPVPAALHQLIGRLRAALPDHVRAIVVLDGPPDPGAPFAQRIGPRLEVRHAGRRDADSVIVELLRDRAGGERGAVLVVTDDPGLGQRVRSSGGVARPLDWFLALLDQAGTTPGPRPPSVAGSPPPTAADMDEARGSQPWRPGRGATRKRGNPRRAPRHRS
jgi:hypothetical protein